MQSVITKSIQVQKADRVPGRTCFQEKYCRVTVDLPDGKHRLYHHSILILHTV